jgi:transketolase
MRNKIIELINKDFKNQKKSFFLTADLGYSVLEGTKKIYKKKFINVGVAENNMLLLACGINEISKNRVYVYSIASFLILRTLEVIRNYISHEKRNICLIGVGSGVSYSKMGKTHFNLDDLNILYSIKNILILNPSNNQELIYLFKKFKNYKYPIYFRINKNNFSNKFKLKRKKNIFQKKG